MIDIDHPFFFLEPIFSKEGSVFHFSRYVYVPDSLFDERESFEVAGEDITVEWLEGCIRALAPNQELAIHSLIMVGDRTFHVPMLDFATREMSEHQLDRVRRFVPPRVFRTMNFYSSGRSYHGYSTTLLEPREWRDFLGRALLVNPKGDEEIIDSRWIGHRLMAGYCSLRFSNNSHQYKGMPRKVGIRALLEAKEARAESS